METFVSWFNLSGGSLDADAMGLADIPGCGRGAIALKDLPEGYALFIIPRELTLSTRTSALPGLLGNVEWKRFRLHMGWAGLILCMLWEEAQGSLSKWSGYLSILPTAFDTPMFWSEDELQELTGTSVVDKIGKENAERDFYEKVVPTVQSRPELFPPDSIPSHYTLGNYHRMGSRILSRSFTVSRWAGDNEVEAQNGTDVHGEDTASAASRLAMNVDAVTNAIVAPSETEDLTSASGSDDEDDGEEDPSDVAMVPMADMLNARYETENAKLFYEQHVLKMVTTKPIKAGEQIWNTYGDPPNIDLLRRYGHVDLIPLSSPLKGEGNPADIVEVRGDFVVGAILDRTSVEEARERIDWWLENGEDDTFVIGTDCELPSDFISFIRLLLQSQAEWDKMRTKSKLPKPIMDLGISIVATTVLEKRLLEYPTSTEDDEALLGIRDLSFRKRCAVVVRLAEKRILCATLAQLGRTQETLQNNSGRENKRKAGNHPADTQPLSGPQKKTRR